MRRSNCLHLLSLLLIGLGATVCSGAIFPQGRGAWPQDWPKELESLRESSRTIGVGTGIQENIYEIPIPDRETFESIWPAILRLRTPGGPLTLYRAGSPPPKAWGDFLSNKKPAIRIYGPTGAYSLKEEIDPQNPPDFEKLIKEGRALRAKAPWPDYIVSNNGELPEYVVLTFSDDGQVKWTPAHPRDDEPEEPRGFYNRARIDVELVIDGQIIDLNHIELPDGVKVVDRRFEDKQ